MKLQQTKQCKTCPWKVEVNPFDIPKGYDLEKHKALISTIANPNPTAEEIKANQAKPLEVMSCHHKHQNYCIGWLHNQIGVGNNIQLRIKMLKYKNSNKLELDGEQHPDFSSTLPLSN